MTDIKKILQETIDRAKEAKANEDATRQKKNDEDRTKILEGVGSDLAKSLEPVLAQLASHSQVNEEQIRNALTEAISVNMPEIDTQGISDSVRAAIAEAFANLKIPAPVVNVPKSVINMPEIKIPETKFPDRMDVGLGNYSHKTPMPVMMVDTQGKPFQFTFPASSTGGKHDFITVKGITATVGVVTINPDGQPIYSSAASGATGSTQLVDSSNNAVGSATNPLNVSLVGGAATSTYAQIGNSDGTFSGTNPLPVSFAASASQAITVSNVVSALNSSAVVLANGGVFTALAEDVTNYASISVSVFADQASATDGLSIQQSSDGSNWDITDVYSVTASTGKVYSVQPISRYFRIVYTNGGTLQGAFRLSTVLHIIAAQPSSQRTSDGYTNETDLQQFWGFNSAFNGTTWDRQRNTAGEGNALRVQMANDAIASVNVVGYLASTASNIVDSSGVAYSGSNPLPMTVVTNATATLNVAVTNSSGVQYSGSNPFPITVVTSATATVNTALTDSGGVQYSGSNPVPITGTVVGITNTIASASVDSTGVQYSGSNPFPFSLVTNATSTVNVAVTDSSGIQYSGSNPLPITIVTNAAASTIVVGDIPAGTADTGSGPVKIGGIARTTNPAVEQDGDRITFTADKLGRQIFRAVQVRDLIQTAYVSVTNGSETTLRAAVAGAYLDLVMIVGSNNSDAAVSVDIRPVTAGNIINTLRIPANGSAGWTPQVPWPQTDTGNNWTVDGPDETGRTLTFSALFSQEI